ncbi:MAG: tetratricopeptide repeat protein [Lachnospiraceae bacterium]|nr:tetratricopeptide repeat protein [Lachnospiraceae bacterium]
MKKKNTGYENYGEMGAGQDNGAQGSTYRAKFLIAALVVLLAVICVAGVFLISGQRTTQKYNSCISADNQYYSAGDYTAAIAEYQKALEVDNGKESAYLNLSYSYVALGDYDSALSIMQEGCKLLDTSKMEDQLAAVQTLINDSSVSLTEEEILILSENVTVENSILDMVAQYSYTNYYHDFGAASDTTSSGDKLTMYYADLGMYVSYYDLDDEVVLASDGSEPIATAKACTVRFEKISTIFGNTEETYAVSYEKLQELLGDVTLYQDEDSGYWYISAEYKNCKLTVQTDENGNITSESVWNQLEPLSRSTEEEIEGGKVSGYILDATTGDGQAASLFVRERGSRTGTILEQLSAASDGSYTIEMEEGQYTVEVSQEGYVTEYADIEIEDGQVVTGENIVISPEVGVDEIRIVLTWGSYPADLDSYAIGTSSEGKSFNINFQNREVSGVGQLDVDDTNGYGPETITITDGGAEFDFSVCDFYRTGLLSSSGAEVKVYLSGETTPYTFTVPSGAGDCEVWEVFSYKDGEITGINSFTYAGGSASK